MEVLPPSCPPSDAVPCDFPTAYRFVNCNPATDADFESYQAIEDKGGRIRPPDVPPCRWSGTSLFTTREAAFDKLPKPRKRFKFLARVSITKDCGVSVSARGHITLWRYATFVPTVHGYESL
jgi:hypothetical protein